MSYVIDLDPFVLTPLRGIAALTYPTPRGHHTMSQMKSPGKACTRYANLVQEACYVIVRAEVTNRRYLECLLRKEGEKEESV